jgi:hypothetical protein
LFFSPGTTGREDEERRGERARERERERESEREREREAREAVARPLLP